MCFFQLPVAAAVAAAAGNNHLRVMPLRRIVFTHDSTFIADNCGGRKVDDPVGLLALLYDLFLRHDPA
jgi:hypothetical protein